MEIDKFGTGNDVGFIFLPGLFAGGWIWSKVATQLEAAGLSGGVFKTAFAEIPSVGDPLEYLTHNAKLAIDRCGFKRVIVCGNSLGGFLALRLFLSQESNMMGCVASGAPGFSKVSNLGLVAKRLFTFSDAEKVTKLLFVDTSCVSEAQIKACLRCFSNRRSLMNIAKYMGAAGDIDLAPTLSRVKSPVLFIWGQEDHVTPLAPVRAKLSSMGNIELKVIENCGHSPMVERPGEFFDALVAYSEKLMLAQPHALPGVAATHEPDQDALLAVA